MRTETVSFHRKDLPEGTGGRRRSSLLTLRDGIPVFNLINKTVERRNGHAWNVTDTGRQSLTRRTGWRKRHKGHRRGRNTEKSGLQLLRSRIPRRGREKPGELERVWKRLSWKWLEESMEDPRTTMWNEHLSLNKSLFFISDDVWSFCLYQFYDPSVTVDL